MLEIKNLSVKRDNTEILKGVTLNINPGKINVIMGPNGSGKSTLAAALMGDDELIINKKSQIKLDGKEITNLSPDKRSRLGLFLAFQYPIEVPGVPLLEFLRLSYNAQNKERLGRELSPFAFKKIAIEKMKELKMDISFLDRNLNEGFSGGEKKKSEILQMAVLEPKYAILDETDSGLDVSALKTVYESTNILAKEKNIGMIIITHYSRILDYVEPHHVHVLKNGAIVKTGGKEIALYLDEHGYEAIDK